MTKKLLLLCSFIILFAVSCVPSAIRNLESEEVQGTSFPATATWENIQNEAGSQCIPPESEWEFPIEPPLSIMPPPIIPPPSEWKMQIGLPENDPNATLAFIERQADYDVVWVESSEKFLRYRVDTKQWSRVSLSNDLEINDLRYLFQDQSGQVWAFGYFQSASVYLARFLRLNYTEQFEFVDDGDLQVYPAFTRQNLLVGKDGTFWILLNDDVNKKMTLSNFDPNTRKLKQYLDGEVNEFGWSIAMGQDGSIFLVRPNNGEVVRYYPDTRASENFGVHYRFEGNLTDFFYPHLFVDRSGNLWIGDYVWIDFKNLTAEGNPTWHQIIRSPAFISKNGNLRQTYLWMRPRPMLESYDGRIWFRGGAAGLVWLDPHQGLWCKFTTIDSEILEDRDGNLWLLYDSNLYKYSLTP